MIAYEIRSHFLLKINHDHIVIYLKLILIIVLLYLLSAFKITFTAISLQQTNILKNNFFENVEETIEYFQKFVTLYRQNFEKYSS